MKVHMVFNPHFLNGLEESQDGEEGVGFSDKHRDQPCGFFVQRMDTA